MTKISTENNFSYLFFALLTLLFSTALLGVLHQEWIKVILDITIFGVFVVGTYSVKTERSWLWAVAVMSTMLVLFSLLHQFISGTIATAVHLLIILLFFIGSFLLSYKQILLVRDINRNIMIGSLVLYLLLGLIWTIIYLLILLVFPDAFNGLEPLSWQENFSRVAYYSFVTLTTLGYGDISPKNSIAEFFVYLQTIAGLFYMAIIVSSLVSSRLAKLQKEHLSDD
jgi:hypothetical protein